MRFKLFIISLLVSICIFGQHRTEKEATDIAANFWNIDKNKSGLVIVPGNGIKTTMRKTKAAYEIPANLSYYIVNDTTNGRFVLISADERMGEILGYSDRSIFEASKMPLGLLNILCSYDQISENIDEVNDNRESNEQTNCMIEPLIKTHWAQDYPYNMDCPEIDGSKCPTGCAATAMAQILNYYKYSPNGLGSHTYSTHTEGIEQYMNFETLNIDWSKLACDYDESSSEDECKEVAKLMHACGVSLSMDYKKGASSVAHNTVGYPLKRFWGYNPNIAFWKSFDFDLQDTHDMLISELKNGHPILVDLTGLLGDHEGIIDGIDENNLYHYNFGWGGLGDGYYNIALIKTTANHNFQYADFSINITPELYGTKSDNFLISSESIPNESILGDSLQTKFKLDCVSTDIPHSIMFINEPLVTTIGVGIFDSKFNILHSFIEGEGEYYSNYSPEIKCLIYSNDILSYKRNEPLFLAAYEKLNDGTYRHIKAKSSYAELYLILFEDESIKFLKKHFSEISELEDNIIVPNAEDRSICVNTQKSNVEITSSINNNVFIYNLTGICVAHFNIKANETKYINLPKGVYLIDGKKYSVGL